VGLVIHQYFPLIGALRVILTVLKIYITIDNGSMVGLTIKRFMKDTYTNGDLSTIGN